MKKLFIISLVLFSSVKLYAQDKGTCTSPYATLTSTYADFAAADAAYTNQQQTWTPDATGTINTFAMVNSGPSGKIGFDLSHNVGAGASDPNCVGNGQREVKLFLASAGACNWASGITFSVADGGNGVTWSNPEFYGLTPNTNYIVQVRTIIPNTGGCAVQNQYLTYYQIIDPVSCSTCATATCPVTSITATTVAAARTNMTSALSTLTDQYSTTLTPGGSVTICVPVTVPNGSSVLGFKQKATGNGATSPCASATDEPVTYQLRPASNCSATPILPTLTNATPVGSGFNPEWNNLAAGNYILCYTMTVSNTAACDDITIDAIGYYNVIPACTTPNITSQPTAQTICNGDNTSFNVGATGGSGYQWQVNTGSGFTNITDGGVYSGATSATLTITGAISSMTTYQYQCVISESVGTCPVTSNAVVLTVNSGVAPTYTKTIVNPNCGASDGSIKITPTSPLNSTYSWISGPVVSPIPAGNKPSGATDEREITNLPAGTYCVNVTSPSTAGGTVTSTIFTEDFEATTPNWTIDNNSGANEFIINNTYTGGSCVSNLGTFTVPVVPNQDNAITSTGTNSKYLHIIATTTNPITCGGGSTNPFPPLNSNYNGSDNAPNQYATYNSTIDASGYTNLQLSYYWMGKGRAEDYALVQYSINGGTTWVSASANLWNQATWINTTVSLPATCAIATLKLRVKWTNNSSGSTDPAICIDHIVLKGDQVSTPSCGNTVQECITITSSTAPLAPTTAPVNYCIGDVATALTATGANLLWYTTATLGTGSSTAPTPTTTAAGITTYYVSQTVSGCEGPRASIVVNVTACCVLPTATAVPDFTISCSSFPNGKTIGDPNAATSNVTYKWTPATGLDNDAIANPMANPMVTTVYTLVATASTGTDCTEDATVTVTVNKTIPAANAGNDLTINCLSPSTGVTIGAAAVSGVTCSWSPATGLNDATLSNPTANPTSTTAYTLTTTNTASGCTASNPINVTVDKTPPVADAGNDLSICNGASVNLIGSGGTSYLWSPSTNLNNATISNPTASPTVSTTYTITAINGSCSSTNDMILTVFQAPNANAGADKSICMGGTTTLDASGGTSYAWNNSNDLSLLNVNNPVASPTVTSTFTVTVSENGCFDTDEVIVNVYSIPNASLGIDLEICQGEDAVLTATGGSNFSWNIGGSSSSLTVSPAVNTTYTVTVSLNGCTASDDIVVKVKSAPTINFTSDLMSGCAPLTVNFIDLSNPTPDTYLWNFGDGTTSTTPNPLHTFADAGIYDITLTASNEGCQSFLSINDMISVYPMPSVDFSWTPLIGDEYNNKIDFTSYCNIALNTYTWDFGDPFSNDNSSIETNPSHSFSEPDKYIVWLYGESQFGCKDSIMHEIIIKDISSIYIPNSFTPNGDGFNEFFGPILYNFEVEKYQFYVFNRWGEEIFSTNDPLDFWNGAKDNSNSICQDGVYTWKLIIKEVEGMSYEKIGTVTLLK